MRALWLFIALVSLAATPVGGAERALPEHVVHDLQSAETAYREGRYADALEAYIRLEQGGLSGWVLDYNSGNAAFRSGDLGWAVYFYEKAMRSNPRDPDIRHNYEQAREALGLSGPVENRASSALLQWLARFSSSFSLSDALRLLLALGWIASLVAAARLLWPRWRRPAADVLKVLGVLGVVASLGLGFKVWERGHRPNGVLVSSAEVLSAPQEDAQELTRLAPGTLLRQGRHLGDWVEVEVGEDVRGWVGRGNLRSL
jgi:hypothetical protein